MGGPARCRSAAASVVPVLVCACGVGVVPRGRCMHAALHMRLGFSFCAVAFRPFRAAASSAVNGAHLLEHLPALCTRGSRVAL